MTPDEELNKVSRVAENESQMRQGIGKYLKMGLESGFDSEERPE